MQKLFISFLSILFSFIGNLTEVKRKQLDGFKVVLI